MHTNTAWPSVYKYTHINTVWRSLYKYSLYSLNSHRGATVVHDQLCRITRSTRVRVCDGSHTVGGTSQRRSSCTGRDTHAVFHLLRLWTSNDTNVDKWLSLNTETDRDRQTDRETDRDRDLKHADNFHLVEVDEWSKCWEQIVLKHRRHRQNHIVDVLHTICLTDFLHQLRVLQCYHLSLCMTNIIIITTCNSQLNKPLGVLTTMSYVLKSSNHRYLCMHCIITFIFYLFYDLFINCVFLMCADNRKTQQLWRLSFIAEASIN